MADGISLRPVRGWGIRVVGLIAGTAELVRLAQEVSIVGAIFADFAGLTTEASDTTTETMTVRDATFINIVPLISVEANKTYDIINPVWSVDEASHDDLAWPSTTSNG